VGLLDAWESSSSEVYTTSRFRKFRTLDLGGCRYRHKLPIYGAFLASAMLAWL